jgi:hypothetical protein
VSRAAGAHVFFVDEARHNFGGVIELCVIDPAKKLCKRVHE